MHPAKTYIINHKFINFILIKLMIEIIHIMKNIYSSGNENPTAAARAWL